MGGFKWDDPRFVDVRLQIMNSGAIAQNLVIQVRTSYIFWHVFEVGHFPGLSLRLIDYAGPGGAPGVAMKGVDKDGKEVFVQPSEIAYSSDAEIRCESLDGGEAVMVGFAVTPRDKSLRSLPTRLDLKGSYDYRSNTGLERLKIPVTPISVVANR